MTTTTHVTPAEVTGARTAEAADVITGARERIDALDDRIIGLIQERMAVSAVIQEARITSGGRRVNLSREMEVLNHYSEALGRPGTSHRRGAPDDHHPCDPRRGDRRPHRRGRGRDHRCP